MRFHRRNRLDHPWLLWFRRRWLWCLVSLAFAVLIALRFNEICQIGAALVRGQMQWVLVALLTQVGYYSLYAVLYQMGFLTVGVESHWGDLLPVLLASVFLKAVVPSGGVSSLAVMVDDAAKRGQSSARAAEGALLVLVADLATMVPLLVYGLHYLALRGALRAYQVVGVVIFVLFTAGLGAMLLLARRQPQVVFGVLHALQQGGNRLAVWLRRRPFLPADWALRNAAEFAGAAEGIASRPWQLGRTLALGFLVHLLDVAAVYAIFLAYGHGVAVGAAIVGFAMDVVFSVVTFIPHGLGVAEGAITMAFVSLGVPTTNALVVALAFRGLNVWLPLAIGFLFLHQVRSFGAGRRVPHAGDGTRVTKL